MGAANAQLLLLLDLWAKKRRAVFVLLSMCVRRQSPFLVFGPFIQTSIFITNGKSRPFRRASIVTCVMRGCLVGDGTYTSGDGRCTWGDERMVDMLLMIV